MRILLALLLSTSALAQSTKLWQQSKFDEFEKGTTRGVAILNSGRLELAPAFRPIYTSPSTYLWSIGSDAAGNAYVAAGAPARIYRVQPDGRASVILAPNELQVQSLVVDPNGVIFAATSPDGKVYKIERKPGAQQPAPEAPTQSTGTAPVAPAPQQKEEASRVALDPNYTTSVFFEPKTKYIWALALDREGRLYVATGDRGEIFRVERNGASSTFFKSDEAHIRALAFDNTGNLIAGSDGSGLIYRIAANGEAFVLYGAPKKEVTAIAIDKGGNIYAAAAGDRRAPATPITPAPSAVTGVTPLPSTGQPQVTPISPAPQGVSVIPAPLTGVSGGSEVYRIAPDGSPKRIWSSREDLVYSLVIDDNGRLLAGTGNKGKVFSIAQNGNFTDLLKASANQVIGFARGPNGTLYAATGNLGKVFLIEDAVQREAAYESDVFDAKNFSRWGRAEVLARGNIELFARSGNVDNPDRNWSPWRRIDLAKDAYTDAPPARFIQWRAVLRSGNPAPSIDSVSINYQPKNVAPEIDDVIVTVGSKFQSALRSDSSSQQRTDTPTATRDSDYVAVRWNARDDNDDSLVSSIYYRGDNESNWKLLKADVSDRFYSFESALLPDGGYTLRVITSDAPSHSPDDALSAERESSRFEIDSTPPQVQNLAAVFEADQLHVTFVAIDSSSPIRRAEFSLNAGDWQVVEPVGELSDSKLENYDLYAPLPTATTVSESNEAATPAVKGRRGRRQAPPVANPNEQVIVVRAYDRSGNMGSAKLVVRPPTQARQ